MTWAKKFLAPVALATGLGFAAMAYARTNGDYTYDDEQEPQPAQKKGFDRKTPFGGGFDRKADPKGDPQPEPRRVPQPPRGERSDGGLEAWVQTLTAKITDPHDLIRDSARGALVGVGRPAIPALQKLADGDDAAKSVAAKRVIAAIEAAHPQADGRRGPFGPGSPGGPGMGPGGRTGFDPNFRPNPAGPGGGRPGPGGPGEGGSPPPIRPE